VNNVAPKSEATRTALKQAFIRIKKNRPKIVDKKRKMSIAAVAEESGYSRATIHKYYPDIAELIRGEAGRDVRTQRDEKNELLKKARDKNKALQKELKAMRVKISHLSSINATLTLKNNRLEGLLGSGNVTVLKAKK